AGICGLGGGKGDAVVAPEVAQRLAGKRIEKWTVRFLELVNRQQFDSSHAEGLEIGDLLNQACESSRPGYAGGRVAGEAANMKLKNSGVLPGAGGGHFRRPIEGLRVERAGGGRPRGRWLGKIPPGGAVGDPGRGRTEQYERPIKAVPAAIRSVHAPAIAKG